MIRQRLSNHYERILDMWGYRRAPDKPKQLHLSVTDRCFLPCKHCDIWKNDSVDLPTKPWLDVIDRLGSWCAPAGMNFVGGEPLLRKDLELLMSRAVNHGFEVSFNTNGWLMTEERAKKIAGAGVQIAYVSLDGLNPETIDHSRGRAGSYDKAIQAIEHLLASNGPRVIIAAILHAQNAKEMPALLNWVEKNDMQLVIQPLYQNFGDVKYDPDWWKTAELWPQNADEVRDIDNAIDKLTSARLRGRPVCNEAAQLQAMKFHFNNPDLDSGLSCRAGHSDLSIDPHGKIRLCYFLKPVGTMSEDTDFPLIWNQLTTLKRRWEVSRCDRHCNLLNCNFNAN